MVTVLGLLPLRADAWKIKVNHLFVHFVLQCRVCHLLPPLMPLISLGGSSTITGSIFCEQIHKAYESIVHWRHNLFLVPFGSVGSHFVIGLAKLYESYGSASAMESIALKAAMVLPPLLLQKPHRQSKFRENIKCLVC